MALKSKLSDVKSTNPTGDKSYLTDVSGNHGDITYTKKADIPNEFEEKINITGYGAPNSERSDVANFLVGFAKRMSGDIPIGIHPVDHTTAMEYVADTPPDGWAQYYLIQVPAISNLTADELTEFAAGYDKTSQKLFQKRNGLLVPIESKDLITNPTYNVFLHEEFVLVKTSFNLQKMLEQFAKLKRESIGEGCSTELKKLRERLWDVEFLLRSAKNSYCLGNKYDAQAKIEFITTNIEGCVC